MVTDEADNTGVPTVAFVSDVSDGNTCPETITRTYSVTDDCGNQILVTQTITVNDITPPVLAAPPANITVECAGDVPAMTNLNWTDNCDGAGSVVGVDGEYFLCKFKTMPGDEIEIMAPLDAKIDLVDNEIGKTYQRDGKLFVMFKQLVTQKKKVYEEIHSGNTNPITLPTKMPAYTFLRVPAHHDMGTNPKK